MHALTKPVALFPSKISTPATGHTSSGIAHKAAAKGHWGTPYTVVYGEGPRGTQELLSTCLTDVDILLRILTLAGQHQAGRLGVA